MPQDSISTSRKSSRMAAHALQCMEVWGGNTAVESGISIPGIDAWVFSQPFHAQASGGDVHYVSMCGMGRIGRFMMADVSGHGTQVSELVAHAHA